MSLTLRRQGLAALAGLLLFGFAPLGFAPLGFAPLGFAPLGFLRTSEGADGDPTFEASLEIEQPEKDGKAATRALIYKGKVPEYPLGTRIDIRFKLKENVQHINWYRALLSKEGDINGKNAGLVKPFAPGSYEVEFWLKMSSQDREIKKWFKLNRGFLNNHQEVLDTIRIRIGNNDDELKFQESCVEKLRGYFAVLKDYFQDLARRAAAKEPKPANWAAMYQERLDKLAAMQKDFHEWTHGHEAMPLEKYRVRISELLTFAIQVLEAYHSSQTAGLDSIVKPGEDNIRFLEEALSTKVSLEPEVAKPAKRKKTDDEKGGGD